MVPGQRERRRELLFAWQCFYLAEGEYGLWLGLFHRHKAQQHNNMLISTVHRDQHAHCQLQCPTVKPCLPGWRLKRCCV